MADEAPDHSLRLATTNVLVLYIKATDVSQKLQPQVSH